MVVHRRGYAADTKMEKILLEDLCSVDEPPPAPPPSLTSSDKDATTTTEAPTTPLLRVQPSWAAIKQFMIKVVNNYKISLHH